MFVRLKCDGSSWIHFILKMDAIRKLGHEVDRKAIIINEEHIKTLGTYTAKLKLMKDMIAEIKFEVIEE